MHISQIISGWSMAKLYLLQKAFMGEILMKKYMKTLLMEALGTQIVVRQFFHQAVVKQSSGSCQAALRQSSGSPQAVLRHHLKRKAFAVLFFFFLILGSGIHFSASLTKTKDNDDQSALAEIIHHMADNIIDGSFKIWISDLAFKRELSTESRKSGHIFRKYCALDIQTFDISVDNFCKLHSLHIQTECYFLHDFRVSDFSWLLQLPFKVNFRSYLMKNYSRKNYAKRLFWL